MTSPASREGVDAIEAEPNTALSFEQAKQEPLLAEAGPIDADPSLIYYLLLE